MKNSFNFHARLNNKEVISRNLKGIGLGLTGNLNISEVLFHVIKSMLFHRFV